ncbi:MAG: M23 family metallopeptidase [Gemmatimonadaceae bacterium]
MLPSRTDHRAARPRRSSRALVTLALLLAAACGGSAATRDALDRLARTSPHERYARSLRDAGLGDAALGREWSAAAQRALRSPLAIPLPYRETGYFAPDEAASVGLRMTPRRGQRLTVRVETEEGAPPAALFVDLFEQSLDSADVARGEPPRLVASAEAGRGDPEAPGAPAAARTLRSVVVDVDRQRVAYVLRLQPELLRGVRYTVTVEAGPSLAFPLPGRDSRAVLSFYGADRDAGRRHHEGVDLFARRGTPIVAATGGVVAGVGVTQLGGKVVWLRDVRRGQSLYYAHLDSQLVSNGAIVRAGDTLGLVGNTGNARTTSPHLHFGVYRRGEGAVDPFPYIDTRTAALPRVTADTTALGAWRRVAARRGAPLIGAPLPLAPVGAAPAPPLPAQTALRVDGAAGPLYRVRLPDGSAGFVAARLTEPAEHGARLAAARLGAGGAGGALREKPLATASVVDSVAPHGRLEVLGRFGTFILVRPEGKKAGWLARGR